MNTTELPDGALDAILSALCSLDIEEWLLTPANELEHWTWEDRPKAWEDIINFRLVAKSFQRVTDRVVPSFALYQQLFNKGVDPSVWITEQEQEFMERSNCLLKKRDFVVKDLTCDLIQLPDLSSMPLVALESMISIAIHKVLVSHAVLANSIDITYAFPSDKCSGFVLTLPSSSLFPGKQLTFHLTNSIGLDYYGDFGKFIVVIIEVADSSLAQTLGIVPNKANLVLYQNTHHSCGETQGEVYTNLSSIMPIYSTDDWILNLLQVGTAYIPYLDNKWDHEVPEVQEYENWYPPATVFDYNIPASAHNQRVALLCQLPLLPGVVVNQIQSPNNKSLLQLLMLNKLVQFYRLNKGYKQSILAKTLQMHSNTCYQKAITQLFTYLTFIEHLSSTTTFVISFGEANPKFQGCYLEVEYKTYEFFLCVKAKDDHAKAKISPYFGSKCLITGTDPQFFRVALQMQKLLELPFILPPVDILSLFMSLVTGANLFIYDHHGKQMNGYLNPKLELAFDATEVDPSCHIHGLKVHEEDGKSYTALFSNSFAGDWLYAVLQILHSHNKSKYFLHLRFGYKQAQFTTDCITQQHFVETTLLEYSESKNLYDYWLSCLTKPQINNDQLKSLYAFDLLSIEQEPGAAYEIWYAKELHSYLMSLKSLFKNNKMAAFKQINQLQQKLPANTSIKCCYAKMIAESEGCHAAIKYLNCMLHQDPFHGQVTLTKAKILQNAGHYKEAIRCYVQLCDFSNADHTQNAVLTKSCQKLFTLFPKYEMWSYALNIWKIFNIHGRQLLARSNPSTMEQVKLMLAEKHIRKRRTNHHLLKRCVADLQQLPSSLKKIMLLIEASFILNSILKTLDKLLQQKAVFEVMIHKGVILHELQHFDEAVTCYEKALAMPDRYDIFDIHSSLDAAKNKQKVPWPFKATPPNINERIWTGEEMLMQFILHPNAVTSAKKKVSTNSTQNEPLQFLLREIDTAELQMNVQQECYAHLYPVDHLFSKFFKTTCLKFIHSIPKAPQIQSDISNLRDQAQRSHFTFSCIWQLQEKSNTLLWYPTHPCAIPYLLQNGISPDENGAKFYPNIDSCAKHAYEEKDINYEIMALLVEVDSMQNASEAVGGSQKMNNQSPVAIYDKAQIRAICYIVVITEENRYPRKNIGLITGKYFSKK